MRTVLPDTRTPDRAIEPLVHIGPYPYTTAYCGKPRAGAPLRPGAEVTCVVCADLREARRRRAK